MNHKSWLHSWAVFIVAYDMHSLDTIGRCYSWFEGSTSTS